MSMKILVAGATGKTGRQVVADLKQQGHDPVALVRDGSDTSVLPSDVSQRSGDLTDLPQDICDGMDAVIFAAGSGGSTGPEMTDKVDRDGAQTLVDRAKQSGAQRFVMLSSVGADNPDPDHELGHYLMAKHDADEHLKASGLTYAILRPVALTDGDRSDQVVLGTSVDKSAQARRADVAAVLSEAAVTGKYDGQALDMQSA